MSELRKYGVATTILFPLIDRGAVDFESTPVSFVAADTQISKDEAAFANTGSTPVHEGNGIYSLALTTTEMEAARISITVIDAATKEWEDQAIIIETYGDASGQHAFDLDTAQQSVTVASMNANVVNAAAIAAGAITAIKFGLNAIDAAAIATDAIGSTELSAAAANKIRDTILSDATTFPGASITEVRLAELAAANMPADLDSVIASVGGLAGAAMRGTDSAALASVMGALADGAADGDPTVSDTAIAYIKQLINVLVGTTGIVTFPAEAAPANNVSLSEVIRALHADVTGLNGDVMRGTDAAALASVCTEVRLAELAAGNIPADVDSILGQTGTTGVVLTAAAVDSILDEVVEGAVTMRQLLRILLSSAALKLSGAATTTVRIRDLADAKDRIVATVDSDGNRTASAVDGT